MADFLKLTARSISNISEQANNYSKLGKAAPGKVPESHINMSQQLAVASTEVLRELKSCWKEVALDLTQLGLSLVGLLEIAPPLQASVDIANGGIDIARGHPYIGAISIGAAVPLLGFLPGIGLGAIRFFKVIWSGLKFIALAVAAPVRIAWQFIKTNKKIFTYLPKTDEIVEGAVNVGKEIKNAVVSLYERLKKVDIDNLETQKFDTSYTNNNSIFNGWNNEQVKRSEYAKYALYNNTYGNLGKNRIWNLWNK